MPPGALRERSGGLVSALKIAVYLLSIEARLRGMGVFVDRCLFLHTLFLRRITADRQSFRLLISAAQITALREDGHVPFRGLLAAGRHQSAGIIQARPAQDDSSIFSEQFF